MGYGIQTKIALETGLSVTFISLLITGKRRPSWQTAKKIAAVTKTSPVLWMEGDTVAIRRELDKLEIAHSFKIKKNKCGPNRTRCANQGR